jgi:hypothetical protein
VGVDFLDQGNFRLHPEIYVHEAIKGHDWEALIKYLEEGHPLTDELRAYIVKILRGWKRPDHRPRKISSVASDVNVIACLAALEHLGGIKNKTEAQQRLADHLGVSLRTIQRRARHFKLVGEPIVHRRGPRQ